MNILIFEYIVGGGFAGQALPPSLASEGGMMLQALLDDLKALPNLSLLLPLDQRYRRLSLPPNVEVVAIAEHQNVIDILPELMARCDAVWPIAPESDGVLADIAKQALAQEKLLLLSRPEAVSLCGDKFATYQALSSHGIPAVETLRLSDQDQPSFSRSVIKPIDGVGCLGGIIINDGEAFLQAKRDLSHHERYVVQPFCEGGPISLSCLFDKGKGWLICCNQQNIAISDDRFSLQGCTVNVQNPLCDDYQDMVTKIARAIPELWGYVGIDIIETTDQGPLILEINPRLTTSYVGIRQATGINVAEQTLRLLKSTVELQYQNLGPVEVTIN